MANFQRHKQVFLLKLVFHLLELKSTFLVLSQTFLFLLTLLITVCTRIIVLHIDLTILHFEIFRVEKIVMVLFGNFLGITFLALLALFKFLNFLIIFCFSVSLKISDYKIDFFFISIFCNFLLFEFFINYHN